MAAEFEATQLYMQLAESTDNKLAVNVLKDVADEERVPVGEFLRLLKVLAPDEKKVLCQRGKKSGRNDRKKEVMNSREKMSKTAFSKRL